MRCPPVADGETLSRRTYRYNPESKQVEEVGADWTDVERRAPVTTEALVYGSAGLSTDGVDLSTRKRHREYMKASGVAMASDYTQSWEQAAKKRDDFYAGNHKHEGLREAISRSIDQVRRQKK